ncbi:MAG TPA: phosphoenolpyruvate--protein phosphotransferase [candidate division Zixibacteria bacterium]|nr:phosphoenolpyruvate--protein phosphotransferase [candidate division Zixibacteria bacterium]
MSASRRKVIAGFPIAGGIALGKARVVLPGDMQVAEVAVPAQKIQAEIDALDRAVERTIAELRDLHQSADKKMGLPLAKIFDAQLLIASDYEFLKQVKDQIIARRRNAGFVYNSLVQNTTSQLKRSGDRYMRQMVQDIEAVSSRVLSYLTGYESCELHFSPNTIMIGRTFSPGDILGYRNRKAIAFVVAEGGADSHMALIARSLMMPVVATGPAWSEIPNEAPIIVDGTVGKIIMYPTDDEWADYQKRRRRLGPAFITRLRKLSPIPPLTADGIPFNIAANVSIPGPVDDVLSERKIPVGLFRTEFMYLANGSFPDEDTQYEFYRRIAEKFKDTTVVLRTFDLGYDKVADDGVWPDENNPALGWRGIRAMLDMSIVFKNQISAVLRASTLGNIKIMLPMISQLHEIEKAKKLISQVKLGLRRKGIPYDENIEVGIMVEVPSAALLADKLAPKVDFMSIGTNDLTQYTMAADRQNRKLGELYSPYQPAVLQLVNMTVRACREHGIPVSICGEVAGDILALPLFIGMGVDTLSMAPRRILDVCRTVKRIDSQLVKHLVAPIMASTTTRLVMNKLESFRSELEKKNPKYKGTAN